MTLVKHDDWELSEKGRSDVERHREKIDQHIRKNVRGVIAEESIITSKRGKKVRIPVRGLKDWKFVYGIHGQSGGIGQGEGKEGDIIRKKVTDGKGGGGAGQGSDDYLETEVDIDYLINIMFQDLGLPFIEEKTKIQNLVPIGWKFESISKVGAQSRLHPKRTMMEAMKRTMEYVGEIMTETECSEDYAHRALVQAKGDLEEAITIARDESVEDSIKPGSVFLEDDDRRFKQIEEDVEYHSNAVVLAMCDTSYSMGTKKKYLARSLLFWLTEFLRKAYTNVEIRFITHTTTAEVVDEDTFFKAGRVGGTNCYTAFDLADYMIETEYPVDEWNVYVIYLSDGEDWDHNMTLDSIQKVLDRNISMLGYVEVQPEHDDGITGGFMSYQKPLLHYITNKFKFTRKEEHGTNFYMNKDLRFLACRIIHKEHIYPALKHLLFENKEGKKK